MSEFIGVDNGVSGGLCALSESSVILGLLPMPFMKARKGNEIDILTVHNWVQRYPGATVVIEEPGGSKSAKAGSSMAGSFHSLRTLCVLRGIRWHRITPQSWQKVMLPDCKAGDTKKRALSLVRELWPSESFLASERCRVPDDGLIDAALIAEHARRIRM